MGSWCQNAEKPPSFLQPPDLRVLLAALFSIPEFPTHFNDYYDFKESNFHHCLSSAG